MAEFDFGDGELFQHLEDSKPVSTHIRFTDDDEEDVEDTVACFRDRLKECEENVQRLQDENQMLKRKLSILTRPSGVKVEDVNMDGPLLQILYANNSISKQCRQEIEDCFCSILQKHQKQGNEKKNQMKPQNSAFVLEEDQRVKSSSGRKTVTEAYNVVGCVLYFSTFTIDKLGQPLLNENPQMTEGWEVPIYQQVFSQVIGADGQDIEMKEQRPKSMCFNCGSVSHQLRDCPKPKDQAQINERRKEFNQNSNQTIHSNRYHAEVEERFAQYKPGVLSEDLLSALGVNVNTLPPLIYRMRQLGYPPGWLKEAEMENSGLMLYDGKASDDGEREETNGQKISYDLSKLVDFPGFNVPAPPKIKDEYMQYGSIPMQHNHMKHNFAAYLSNNFPASGSTSNKRRHTSDCTPQQRKKRRSSPERSSDMDVDSGPGTPCHSSGFQFQSPLPPGSPCFSSPPPLPQGTPPATPPMPPLPKGTPPPTPTNGSLAVRGKKWVVVDETGEETEDGLTLEELEEQQRRIWEALEKADMATNSDCETPATGTSVPSSPSISTPARIDTESEMEVEDVVDSEGSVEVIPVQEVSPDRPGPVKGQEDSPQRPGPAKVQDHSPQSPGPAKVQEDSPQSPGPAKVQEDSPQSPGPAKVQDDSPHSPGPVKTQEATPQSPEPSSHAIGSSTGSGEKVGSVPHRSRFAAGIVPFEDTPEFTEVAEATGTYLRIRDLLKGSPRNLAKIKK